MNRRFIHPATLFFLLTILIAVLSWVGSIYGWAGVQNLLSPEGLRWTLRNVVYNFLDAPFLGNMLVLLFGVGLWLHSGLWNLCRRLVFRGQKLSRKEKRAFVFSLTTGAVCCAVCCLLAFGPWNVVRSIQGTLTDSPFVSGLGYLLSVSIGLMAVVYGYAIDIYRSDHEIVQGMSYGFIRFSGYFVILFFVSQFFCCLAYTRLDDFLHLSPREFDILYLVCCIMLLFYQRNSAK
ncbi:AbgT family transporter [uncultured Bacteroides sp.]|uniref:AbgT family transporter n=1 Tax=uncultured Bacteroides sp. TaxID=162156 RepID=UPI002624FC88|nr:AbgT family transporter [uncultured Bacteroides sp.]